MEKGEKIMLTIVLLVTNYVAYKKHLEYNINNPKKATGFSGNGCLIFLTLPFDIWVISNIFKLFN